MNRIARMKIRRWADTAVIIAAVYALVFAIWAPEAAGTFEAQEETRNRLWWWLGHLLGGGFALAAVFVALKSKVLAKVLLGSAVVFLLLGLLSFQEIDGLAFRTLILPAIVMALALPFFGPMPMPEDEGRARGML